jgi:hypothetical protein
LNTSLELKAPWGIVLAAHLFLPTIMVSTRAHAYDNGGSTSSGGDAPKTTGRTRKSSISVTPEREEPEEAEETEPQPKKAKIDKKKVKESKIKAEDEGAGDSKAETEEEKVQRLWLRGQHVDVDVSL